MISLPEKVKAVSKKGNVGVFEISPLYPGYGMTVGNSLRRVLLSSLPGAAITAIKIKGVDHEFSTLEGIQEDVLEIIRNLKKIRLKVHSDGPAKLILEKSTEGEITSKDIKTSSDVEIINEDQVIATITKKGVKFEAEIEVENGIGFVPVEMRQKEKLAVGVIAIDAVFNPVKKVNYEVENIRVGQRTDFNKIIIEIKTDGTIAPKEALEQSARLLIDHFQTILGKKGKEKEEVEAEPIEKVEENESEEK